MLKYYTTEDGGIDNAKVQTLYTLNFKNKEYKVIEFLEEDYPPTLVESKFVFCYAFSQR